VIDLKKEFKSIRKNSNDDNDIKLFLCELCLRLAEERDAYRKVAIRFRKDSLVRMNNKDLVVPVWVYLEKDVDEEVIQQIEKKG
jgi:hypothetical protein